MRNLIIDGTSFPIGEDENDEEAIQNALSLGTYIWVEENYALLQD